MNYKYLGILGSGSYGDVFLIQSLTNENDYRAMKIFKDVKEADDRNDLLIEIFNQLKIQQLNLPYIPNLRELYFNYTTQKWYFSYDFFDMDLHRYIKENALSIAQIKSIAYQLLVCIDKLHSNNIIHRDIKPSNILITKTGIVGICDFGISMANFNPEYIYPREVCTMWYRPPEVVLNEHYDYKIDVWSIGCVIAELLDGKALFPYATVETLIEGIYFKMGTPNSVHYPGLMKMKLFKEFEGKTQHLNYRWQMYLEKVKVRSELLSDLLNKIIVMDPELRISAAEALKHPFFDDVEPEIMFNTRVKCQDLKGKFIFNTSKYTLINHTSPPKKYLSLDFLSFHKKLTPQIWQNMALETWKYINQITNWRQRMLVYLSTITFIGKHLSIRDGIKEDYLLSLARLVSKYYRVVYCDIRSREIQRHYTFMVELLRMDGFGTETDYYYQIVVNYLQLFPEEGDILWKLVWLITLHYPLLTYLTTDYISFLHLLIIKQKVIPLESQKYLEDIKKQIGEKKDISPQISGELPEVFEIIDLLSSHP